MVKSRKHKNKLSMKEKQIVADPGHELRMPPVQKQQKKIINVPKEDFDDETVVESDSESIEYLDDDDDAVELYENDAQSGCASNPVSFFKSVLFLFIVILICIIAVPFAEPLVMAFAPSQCKYPTVIVALLGSVFASIVLKYL
jgi:hypothetical protein